MNQRITLCYLLQARVEWSSCFCNFSPHYIHILVPYVLPCHIHDCVCCLAQYGNVNFHEWRPLWKDHSYHHVLKYVSVHYLRWWRNQLWWEIPLEGLKSDKNMFGFAIGNPTTLLLIMRRLLHSFKFVDTIRYKCLDGRVACKVFPIHFRWGKVYQHLLFPPSLFTPLYQFFLRLINHPLSPTLHFFFFSSSVSWFNVLVLDIWIPTVADWVSN